MSDVLHRSLPKSLHIFFYFDISRKFSSFFSHDLGVSFYIVALAVDHNIISHYMHSFKSFILWAAHPLTVFGCPLYPEWYHGPTRGTKGGEETRPNFEMIFSTVGWGQCACSVPLSDGSIQIRNDPFGFLIMTKLDTKSVGSVNLTSIPLLVSSSSFSSDDSSSITQYLNGRRQHVCQE